jgi:hypothetical protein
MLRSLLEVRAIKSGLNVGVATYTQKNFKTLYSINLYSFVSIFEPYVRSPMKQHFLIIVYLIGCDSGLVAMTHIWP